MRLSKVKKAMQDFAVNVITEARKNARKDFTTGTGYLADNPDSMTYQTSRTPDGLQLTIIVQDYVAYKDAGVFGANPKSVRNGEQKGEDNDSVFGQFRYRTKKPPMETLREWAVKNNIRFREGRYVDGKWKSTGRFAKGGYDTIAFWLQKRIFAQGLAPSMFFTTPFQKYYNALPDAILENFGLEIERLLKEEN
jgi:hypothetical protein